MLVSRKKPLFPPFILPPPFWDRQQKVHKWEMLPPNNVVLHFGYIPASSPHPLRLLLTPITKRNMPTWRIYLLNAFLFALLFIQTTSVIIRDIPAVSVPDEGTMGKTTAASPSQTLDEFLDKLGQLKRHLPKEAKEKHPSFGEETSRLLENLKNILAFLWWLDDLTEKMKPHRQNYRSSAPFDNQFHARCDQSISDIKVVMRDMGRINPHSIKSFNNVMDFLEHGLIFKEVEGKGGIVEKIMTFRDIVTGKREIGQKMMTLRDKVVEYVALLQIEKMHLHFQVHTLTQITKIIDVYLRIFETKYIPEVYKSAYEFVKSLSPEEEQEIKTDLEERDEKMKRNSDLTGIDRIRFIRDENERIFEYLQEIYYRQKGQFSPENYQELHIHELMNGATRELVNLLLEIIHDLLAGHEPKAKTLETTWIMAEQIVLPAFDVYTEYEDNVHRCWVSDYLKKHLALPDHWLASEMAILQDGNNMPIYAKHEAQIRYNTGLVLFTYETIKQKCKQLSDIDPSLVEIETVIKENEWTNAYANLFNKLPKDLGELLERAYKGTLQSNMLEEGKDQKGHFLTYPSGDSNSDRDNHEEQGSGRIHKNHEDYVKIGHKGLLKLKGAADDAVTDAVAASPRADKERSSPELKEHKPFVAIGTISQSQA